MIEEKSLNREDDYYFLPQHETNFRRYRWLCKHPHLPITDHKGSYHIFMSVQGYNGFMVLEVGEFPNLYTSRQEVAAVTVMNLEKEIDSCRRIYLGPKEDGRPVAERFCSVCGDKIKGRFRTHYMDKHVVLLRGSE